MKNLKIATWNIGNEKFDLSKNDRKINSIINMLIFGDLDVLSLQEVNPLMVGRIEERLKSLKGEYTITTSTKKYLNPVSNLIVENNIIISRLKPSSVSVDTELSTVSNFSLQKYNKTKLVAQIFDFEEEKLAVNVTHLSEDDKSIRGQQFNEIIEEIDIEKLFIDDIILMGKLNSKLSELNMAYFSKRLNDYGLMIIDNPYNTIIGDTDNQPVDYIVVPKTWEVEWSGLYAGSIVKVDKHFPVVASITKKLR